MSSRLLDLASAGLGALNSVGSDPPAPPEGFVYIVDENGAYYIDENGAYYIEAA